MARKWRDSYDKLIRCCVMPKKITPGLSLYVAHGMVGSYGKNGPIVTIEETGEEINPYLIKSKIRIYERQVEGWFLSPARKLLEEMPEQAGFAVLGICFAYLEGVQQYREGRSSISAESKIFFRDSFSRVFGSCGLPDSVIDMVYKDGRNGLFHDGMTRSRVIYDLKQKQPFSVVNNKSQDLVFFHPSLVVKGIEEDFKKYIGKLKTEDNATERINFDAMFSVV